MELLGDPGLHADAKNAIDVTGPRTEAQTVECVNRLLARCERGRVCRRESHGEHARRRYHREEAATRGRTARRHTFWTSVEVSRVTDVKILKRMGFRDECGVFGVCDSQD